MSAVTRDVMEARIKRMLELERMSGDVQAALRQSQARSLPMPELADELLEELDGFDSPEDHPDFVEYVSGQPLIEREGFAVDKYRSLRYRMGSDGPCCHRKHLHAVLRDVEDDEDLPLVAKALHTAFNRHMRFSTTTSVEVVKACARGGTLSAAFPFVLPGACERWRLPVDASALNQLMLELAIVGDEEGMKTLLEAQLAASRKEQSLTPRGLFFFVKGMAEAGNLDGVIRGILLSRNRSRSVPLPLLSAASPCLADLGADASPESATAKKRIWRVFGLISGACAARASSFGLAHTLFATNPKRRAAAREADPEGLRKVQESLPGRISEAFEALSTAEPPAALAAKFEREAALAAAAADGETAEAPQEAAHDAEPEEQSAETEDQAEADDNEAAGDVAAGDGEDAKSGRPE